MLIDAQSDKDLNIFGCVLYYSCDVDLDARDSFGFAPLHNAVKNGSANAIQVLIDGGADKEIRSSHASGYLTPVLLAVQEGQVDRLETLIKNKVDLRVESIREYPEYYINRERKDNYGVLSLSVLFDKPECLRFLLSMDEDIWRPLEHRENTLHAIERGTIMGLAAKLERLECLEILLENFVSPSVCGRADPKHAVCLAAESGNMEVLNLLLNHNIHIDLLNAKRTTVAHDQTIFIAALRGHLHVLKRLVDAGFRLNYQLPHLSGLHAAAAHGHVECLKFCIEHRMMDKVDGSLASTDSLMQKDMYDHSALWHAANQGHPECVEVFINAGVWPATFEEGIEILKCTAGHKHCCVTCQNIETCVCYSSHVECQMEDNSHWRFATCSHYEKDVPGRRVLSRCTANCGCRIGECIKLICKQAIEMYGEESEVGEHQVYEILNLTVNASIWNDQPDILKWALIQGADPTQAVYRPFCGKVHPLIAALYADSLKCLKVLLDHGKTFTPDTISNIEIPAYEITGPLLCWAISMDGHKTGGFMKALLDVGCNPNERFKHQNSSNTLLIVEAVNNNMAAAKVMLSYGVSVTLNSNEGIVLVFDNTQNNR